MCSMLKELLQKQRSNLSDFFERIDVQGVEETVEMMSTCLGGIIFTGVGKSGFVAEKVAMTFMSTGTRAHYLSAGNALHGDIGLVTSDDIVVIMSRSGETEELLKLVPYMKDRGAKVHAWVCREGSTLGKLADREIVLPMEKEICPYDLAPTTSAALQMIFGDVIAVWLMERQRFSLEEYQKNHPHGQIGKRIQLKVKDVMLKGEQIPTCRGSDLLGEVLVELTNKRCGCLVVIDEKRRIEGVFTDGDLRRALQDQSIKVLEEPIVNLMTQGYISTKKEERAEIAKKTMQKKRRVMMLPVVEDDALVGLLHMHDLIQAGI
jgi:arabinose-5-phosphate isomerase